MKNNFVFLAVGDIKQATQLTNSIKMISPESRVFQCSDTSTPRVANTDDILRMNYDGSNIMEFRLKAFSALSLTEPAAYVDTDMLMRKQFSVQELVGTSDVALCRRSFGCHHEINTRYLGMDLSEYTGKTFGEIYPYLACFTISNTSNFWNDCLINLYSLPKKYMKWYGDQEAIRNIYIKRQYSFIDLPESNVACLPDYLDANSNALMVHYKGMNRKIIMQRDYDNLIKLGHE